MDLSLLASIHIFQGLILAAVLGMVLGAERVIVGKMAGMRTYALVSMGAALFVTVSLVMTEQYLGLVNFDPLRVASQIVVGIGFIGAGLIIFKDSHLSGLTTAAGLWVAAGIGMACGFGLYSIAIFATVLTLLMFSAVWYIEHRIISLFKKDEAMLFERSNRDIHNNS